MYDDKDIEAVQSAGIPLFQYSLYSTNADYLTRCIICSTGSTFQYTAYIQIPFRAAKTNAPVVAREIYQHCIYYRRTLSRPNAALPLAGADHVIDDDCGQNTLMHYI